MPDIKTPEPVRRVVAKPTFIHGSLHLPGAEVMAVPKTYPTHYPEGHPQAYQEHPRAGQVVDNDGDTTDGFGRNLIAPEAAAEQGVTRAAPARPEGVPDDAVHIGGHWFMPVGSSSPAPDAPADADQPKTLADLSKQALKAILDSKNIAYPANATTAALIELAEANNIPVTA